MRNGERTGSRVERARGGLHHLLAATPIPRPTAQFRRRAWIAFQRALDPLGPPKQLPRR